MKDKVEVTSGSFGNFANLSSYLRLKSFAWKWDYVISFFNGRWILSNFWYLDCYNFCYIFSKIAKLYFLEASHRSLKTPQKSYSEGPLLRRNDPLKIWKCFLLRCLLFQKQKILKFWIFLSGKYFDKRLPFLKIWHTWVNYCWNYGPSKLLFYFIYHSLWGLNKRQRKTSTNSLIYSLESYYWKKCLVKVLSFLTYWLENDAPLKFSQNWTEKTFYWQFLASLEISKVVF